MVDWNGVKSAAMPIVHGVRQGSILGPILFLIATANLNGVLGKSVAYADDSATWCSAKSWDELRVVIESEAAKFVEAAARLGLKANGSKTQLLLHGPRPPPLFSVSIDGAEVQPAQ